MVQADYLFLMTDVDCLYDKNPRIHPNARAIEVVEDVSILEADVSSAGSALGTGGMSTKIVAARLAGSAGVTTVITRSSNPGNIVNILSYVQAQIRLSNPPKTPAAEDADLSRSASSSQLNGMTAPPPVHTRFLPDPHPIRDRSFWLLHGIAPHGTVFIDEGAHRALVRKAGLLPSGIVDVEGQFAQSEAVRLIVVQRKGNTHHEKKVSADDDGGVAISQITAPLEVGRALVNYSAAEIMRIKGCQSTEIHHLLGFADSEYVAERENVSLVNREKSRPTTPGPSA